MTNHRPVSRSRDLSPPLLTHLTHDGLLAGGTHPLLLGLDSLLGHVLLQVTQHRVQAGQTADNLDTREMVNGEKIG